MADKIKTFSTKQFLREFIQPDQQLGKVLSQDRIQFFITSLQDLIQIFKLPIPPTRATTHTMIYVTSGIATMKIGFRPVQIHHGECLIIPAGQVFSYDQYEINKGLIINFDPSFLIGSVGSSGLLKQFECFNIWGNPVIRLDARIAAYVTQTLYRVLEEYSLNSLANTVIIQAYFLAALSDLNSYYQPLILQGSKSATTLTNRFKALLHTHIKTKQRVTDYAVLLDVTPNHLNKVVRKVTGKPASQWIIETLIIEAKVLLY